MQNSNYHRLHHRNSRIRFYTSTLVATGILAGSSLVGAQPAIPTAPSAVRVAEPAPAAPATARAAVAPAASTTTSTTAAPVTTTTATTPTSPDAIGININGRNVVTDPAPLLRSGTVFVPLRGVLENLGAKVSYDAATSRIDIVQEGKRYSLQVGQTAVAVKSSVVKLTSAPVLVSGRAFVPLRSLAELFGFKVAWLASTRVVAISEKGAGVGSGEAASVDHRARLQNAGRFGVNINFHDTNPKDVELLLDAAKRAGAGLVKFRFDWNALEPTKGSAFQWPVYDRVVAGARERGLTVVGVLGNTTRWATLYPRSENIHEWRNSPPKPSELDAWDNYVRRVVGRYRNDVQAWQIWESPATFNFRSVAKDYRIVTRRAIEAARDADSKAVIFSGEPGGISLGFIDDLRKNGLFPLINGVSLYPLSQWQPGVPAQAEEMILPLSTLLRDPLHRDKEYWINGLSRLSLETTDLTSPQADDIFNTKDEDLRRQLAQNFTPAAQADYLVRSMTLAVAAGVDKLFWGDLRDDATYNRVDPINAYYGGGLLKRDGTPRPSYTAYSTLTRLIADKKYVGAVEAGPRAVVLVFEGKDETVAVAWAAPAQANNSRLTLDPARDPGLPSSIFLQTNERSQVLDATGKRIGGASENLVLTQRPVWVTSLSFQVAQALRDATTNTGKLTKLVSGENVAPDQELLRAVFAPGKSGVEDGLYWRKYLGFRGAANEFVTVDGTAGLQTTISRDVLNPAGGLPTIYLDVANDFLYFTRGTPIRVTVEVKRPMKTEGPFAPKGGFNIQYDSPTGFKMTPWQVVEGGDGWATFVIDIPDASFGNRDGFDLMINTWGAKQDLVFRSLTLQRQTARVATGESGTNAAIVPPAN